MKILNRKKSWSCESRDKRDKIGSYYFSLSKKPQRKTIGRRPCLLFLLKKALFSLSAPKKYFSNSPPLARLELIGRALISIFRSSSVLPPWRRMRGRFQLIINGAGKLKQKKKKWKKRKRWRSGWVTTLLLLPGSSYAFFRRWLFQRKKSEEFWIHFLQKDLIFLVVTFYFNLEADETKG